MRTKTLGVTITALVALAASGPGPARAQSQNRAAYDGKPLDGGADAVRLFYFTHNETSQDVQTFANLIRTVADMHRVYPYDSRKTIALRGTSAQIGLAEWLFGRLDQRITPQAARTAAYQFPGPAGEEAVRVFYFSQEETPDNLQQMVNLIRSAAGIDRIFPYDARGAIALRGRPDQMALPEWLFRELDKPAAQGSRIEAYPQSASAGGGEVVRLFFFSNDATPRDLQEVVQMIRTTADMQRIFPFPSRRAIALRGSSEQIALAEWLFHQLGDTAGRQGGPR